jgi:hypothetical protein
MDEGEIIEILERVDVDLGQRLQLLRREHPVAIGIEALHRHRRIKLVEGPGVAHAGELTMVVEDDLRAHRGPDMRVGVARLRQADAAGGD